ncbi:unnamed protein product [Adineta steineri]|uniref:Uncharacterized protein n=1 Tax=Adineta steineri TaxID=433720 RepID=A0A818XHP2_9BILA|nr:unnamed protein product [Adineta steineri]
MSETIVESTSNQPLITTNDIDIHIEEKNSSSDPIDIKIPFESSPSNVSKKQKSLVSVYDNSNDGEQQQQINQNSLPLVGILGRNQRSQAFTKRLLLSGFPKPILCDINSNEIDSNEKSNYVSYETFYQRSPSIILITDNLINNFDHLLNHNKQQILIDARELIFKYNSRVSSPMLLPIPETYRAFGNLSNWEIEHGTDRVPVAVEQLSPIILIKFISQLNCFSRGIDFLDQYTYNNNQRIKSFQNCLFPFILTMIIFSLCFIISMIEYNNDKNSYHEYFIYRQASSITAATSLTLLSVLLLIRPMIEIIEFILTKQNNKILIENVFTHFLFIQRWLKSRRYLAWYSLSFALLHLIFLLFSKNDLRQKLMFYPVLFGLFTLVLLSTLSFVYFPWISERLLWHEYRLLTSYLGPFCLLIAFIHVFIHWKYEYYYLYVKDLYHLKFLSMILPFFVLLLRFIIYGIVYPTVKWIENRQKHNKTTIKNTVHLP